MTAQCWKHNGTADVYRYAMLGYKPLRWEEDGKEYFEVLVMQNTKGRRDIIYITWWATKK